MNFSDFAKMNNKLEKTVYGVIPVEFSYPPKSPATEGDYEMLFPCKTECRRKPGAVTPHEIEFHFSEGSYPFWRLLNTRIEMLFSGEYESPEDDSPGTLLFKDMALLEYDMLRASGVIYSADMAFCPTGPLQEGRLRCKCIIGEHRKAHFETSCVTPDLVRRGWLE